MKAWRKGEEHQDHIYFSAKDTLVTTKRSLALLCLVKNAHRPKSNKDKQTLLIAGMISFLPQGPSPKGRDPECDFRLSTEGLFFVSKILLRCFMYTVSCNPNIVSYFTLFLTFSIREDFIITKHVFNCSVVSDSLQPHGLHTRLLCPWNFSGKNMRVDCHFLLEGIFLTQGLSPHPMHHLLWQVCRLGGPITMPSSKSGKKIVMQKIMQLWQNVSEYLHTCPHRTIVLTTYLSTDR